MAVCNSVIVLGEHPEMVHAVISCDISRGGISCSSKSIFETPNTSCHGESGRDISSRDELCRDVATS